VRAARPRGALPPGPGPTKGLEQQRWLIRGAAAPRPGRTGAIARAPPSGAVGALCVHACARAHLFDRSLHPPRPQAYARNSKSSLVRLQEVWQDIELAEAQQVEVLEGVIARAHAVWEDAVAAAEAQQQRLRGEVEAALREIAGIREELGDEAMAAGQGAAAASVGPRGRRHRRGARGSHLRACG
jgi:hypothetical protein